MVISNTGKNRTRDLIVDDILEVSLGTDGTSATVGDTDLGTEIAGIAKYPTITTSDRTINTQYELYSTEANGETITEGAIKLTGDVLLDRFVFPDYDKTENNALIVIDIINIL